MGSLVQFRLWAQEAPPTERRLAAAAALVAMALLAWLLVPARSHAPGSVLASGINASSPGAGGSSSENPAFGSVGTDAPGSGGVTATGGGRSAAGAFSGSTGGHDSGTGGTSGSAGSASPAKSSLSFTASDRGVTADSIRVGFSIVNVAGVQQAGYASGVRTDAMAVVDALVDDANRKGGVLGRKIVADKVSPDLIDSNDQRSKCLQLTETDKVFSVIDSFSLLYETATACVTAEHQTPLFTGNPGSAAAVKNGFPYQISTQNDDNRKMKNLVVAAKGQGFFDPAKGFTKPVGILSDACEPSVIDDATGLKADLKAIGITSWSEFRSDCDLASQERSGAQAVLQFRQAGVTRVLVVAQAGIVGSYLQAAKAAGYYPKYFASDYVLLEHDGNAKKFDSQEFDGTVGVTQIHVGELVEGKPWSPMAVQCGKIMTDHGLEGLKQQDDYTYEGEVLQLCENFELFLQVARKVGPNLTRLGVANALQSIGDFHAAFADLARFNAAGKVTGGDTMKLIQWHGDCTCWHQLTDFGPAAA